MGHFMDRCGEDWECVAGEQRDRWVGGSVLVGQAGLAGWRNRFIAQTDLFDSLMHLDNVGVMQILENVHFSHHPLKILDVLNVSLVCQRGERGQGLSGKMYQRRSAEQVWVHPPTILIATCSFVSW